MGFFGLFVYFLLFLVSVVAKCVDPNVSKTLGHFVPQLHRLPCFSPVLLVSTSGLGTKESYQVFTIILICIQIGSHTIWG